jgi:hypothetical protein
MFRFLDLPVAYLLIFSHPEDFLISASHIINPEDVHGAAGVNEGLTNIMTCFFQSLQGCSELRSAVTVISLLLKRTLLHPSPWKRPSEVPWPSKAGFLVAEHCRVE